MEKTDWKVEGMTCSNCALTVSKYLQNKGLKEVTVNPMDGTVSFAHPQETNLEVIKVGIAELGYKVIPENPGAATKKNWLSTHKQRFLFTLPFSMLLTAHMWHQLIPIHMLTDARVQLLLCLPVFIIGMRYFGRSAWKSLVSGIPNMNVLVALGAGAAFLYSLAGMFLFHDDRYLFFETSSTIITLVFLGNYLEEATLKKTQKTLQSLVKSQKVMANMIAFDDKHQEQIFEIENTQLKTGDLVLINTGEQVPADCKILWGECLVNESIITGESVPVTHGKKDLLIGGSVLESGTIKAQVTAAGKETVLSGIIAMVQKAQAEKPPMQQLADRISTVFVPVVVILAILTCVLNAWAFGVAFDESLMRGIAVLVISCPCAMGLATPAAISVGLGRAARKGIIFRNASSLESFGKIRQVVFDKTGTLTTGNFRISNYHSSINENEFKSIVSSLEKHSSHPIAKCIAKEWNDKPVIKWKKTEEIKGTGVRGEDLNGDIYEAGGMRIMTQQLNDNPHNVYVLKNGKLLGWIDVMDEIRPEASAIIAFFRKKGIKTIMLTGDLRDKAAKTAEMLGINEIHAEKSPSEKLEIITALNNKNPTAMVGDGINDAPSLAKATIGISISEASELAVQQADVVLMSQGITHLPEALGLGRHTFLTIRQNLYWAFSYNIIAIPVAATGLLTPSFSAMAMGFSDVMLAVISLQLFIKKVV